MKLQLVLLWNEILLEVRFIAHILYNLHISKNFDKYLVQARKDKDSVFNSV